MITVDMDTTDSVIIVVDDGHRTTLTLAHQDGADLLNQLNEYYGRQEWGQGTDEKPDKKGLIARLRARFGLTPRRK